MIRQGTWCDLARRQNDVAFVRTLPTGEVICETAEPTPLNIWRRTLPGGELLYLSAAADSTGRVGVIGKSHDDGHARLIIDGEHLIDLGETAAIFGTLLIGHIDGFTAYVLRTATMYEEIRLTRNGDRLWTTPHAIPATSQGFVQVRDGAPVPQDGPARIVHGLSLPSRAGSVWAGQSRETESIALYDETTGQITTLQTDGGQPPHIVDALDGSWVVCSWTDDGSWWARVRRPFAAAQPPIEPPPVTPPPVEPPKENPVEFESKHTALMETVNARFPAPATQEGPMREWTQLLAEQFAFAFPGEGWGCKSTSRGGTQSFDVMARQAGGRLWGYDLAFDAGSSRARLDTSPDAMDLTGQAFIPVTAKNHLGTATPGTPNQGTPPPSGKPIPEAYMPWDVQVVVLTKFIEGIWPKDRVPEVTETGVTGSGTLSRGALGFLIPIQFKTTIAWMNANGQRAPVGMDWWPLADQVVAAAVAEYRRSQPTP
jgi:hypothetical protein